MTDDADTDRHTVYAVDPDETPSMAVINAVAEAADRPLTEIEPLAETIDPDGLNAVLSPDGATDTPVTISFEYCGYHVSVTTEEVLIDPTIPVS